MIIRRAIYLVILGLICPWQPAGAAQGFIDDSGRRIVVKRPFTRIISLYGAHTENLFSLGLDRRIVGVSTSETYPPGALRKKTFSYRDDPERILAARPDLVLIRPMIYGGHRALVDQLERAGVRVVSLQPTTVEQMYGYWLKLGLLTGRQKQAKVMIARFKAGLKAIEARVAGVPPSKRPRVYFEAIHRRMKTFAPRSMAVFVLTAAGGVNVARKAKSVRGTNIAFFGKERILSHAERIDVYLAQVGPMNRVSIDTIKNESGFAAIKAVRQGRIYLVNEKIVSRPTMRLLIGTRKIKALLYPGLRDRGPK